MCGNGVLIGMVDTQVHHRITHKVQIQATKGTASFAVVAGATAAASPTAVGLPIAAGSIRASGTGATAFVWFFRRTDVSPYPLIPP